MSVRSARADRYLEDLARMLTGLEPVQRADVLESVREHLDAAFAELGHEPSEQEVIALLNDLGPPSEVAAQAMEQQGTVSPGQGPPAGVATSPGDMLPGTALGPAGAAPGASGVPGPTGAQPQQGTSPTLSGAWVPPLAVLSILVGSLFGVAVVPLLLLIGGIVLVCASTLWNVGQKVAACVVAPLGILPALPLAGLAAWQVQPGETTGVTASSVVIPLALLAGIGVLIWVWVSGARESTRRRNPHGRQL